MQSDSRQLRTARSFGIEGERPGGTRSRLWTGALLLLIGLAASSGRAGQGVCGGLFGENVCRIGAMEVWNGGAPTGWTAEGECFSDDRVFAAGARSVRLEMPQKGVARLTSSPIRIRRGSYLVRFLFKLDVPSAREGSYARSAEMSLACLDRHGKVLRSASVFLSELPVPHWTYRRRIVVAPAGTTALRVIVSLSNKVGEGKACAFWLDELEVCPYYPPKAPAVKVKRRFAPELGRYMLTVEPGGPGCRVWEGGLRYGETSSAYLVEDPKAASGVSRHWPPYAKGMLFWYNQSFGGTAPGVYRMTLRVRAGAGDNGDPTRPIIIARALYPHINAIGRHTFVASDLNHDGAYHDLDMDFVKPDWGGMVFRIDTVDHPPEFWMDYVLLRPLYRFADSDMQGLFPAMFSARPAPAEFPNRENPRVLLLLGLCAERFRLDEALKATGVVPVKRVYYSISYRHGPQLTGMPRTWQEFCTYDLILFANANAQALGPDQRFMLREWVRQGGGLVILGGHAAYGGSLLKGSFIEEALPVVPGNSRFDVVKNSVPLPSSSHPITKQLNWNGKIVSPYIHQLDVRPGADTVIAAGKRPFLAVGSFGRGRVACIGGAPYGVAPGDSITFWEWESWPELMRNVLRWVSKSRQDRRAD